MRRRPDPFLVVAVAAGCAIAALLQPGTMWGLASGLVLALVLPGWSISHILVPEAERLERAVFSVGLSLASCVLIGLILAAFGQLTSAGWAVGLAATSGLAAVLSDPQLRVSERAMPRWRRHPVSLLFVVVALGMLATAGTRAREGALAQWDRTKIVQLWMFPSAPSTTVTVGVRNGGPAIGRFALEIHAGAVVLASWSGIELAPGQTWEREPSLTIPPVRSPIVPVQVEAVLFRLDGAVTGPVRRVMAWMDAPAAPPMEGTSTVPSDKRGLGGPVPAGSLGRQGRFPSPPLPLRFGAPDAGVADRAILSAIIGGEERHVRNWARRLRPVDTRYVWRPAPRRRPEENGMGRSAVHRVRGLAQSLPGLFSDPGHAHAPPLPDPRAATAIARVAAAFSPDVVHAHNWLGRSFLPLKRSTGPALVLTLHDYGMACPKKSMMLNGSTCPIPFFPDASLVLARIMDG